MGVCEYHIWSHSCGSYLSTICNVSYMSSLQFMENSVVGLHFVVCITEKLLCSSG